MQNYEKEIYLILSIFCVKMVWAISERHINETKILMDFLLFLYEIRRN